MGQGTKISWATDTWNPWRGCTKISAGCAKCYAETLVTTRLRGQWGKGAPRQLSKDFDAPRRWNKRPWICDGCGKPFEYMTGHECGESSIQAIALFHQRRVFSLSLGDWLDGEVPISWLARMLDVIRRCPDLKFLLLSKRATEKHWRERIQGAHNHLARGFSHFATTCAWLSDWLDGEPPSNIWLGASIEDQETADARIPELLKIPARVRFLSCEPMLAPIEFLPQTHFGQIVTAGLPLPAGQINWVIFGGESGQGARPCDIQWIIDGVRHCRAAGVKVFTKQGGSNFVVNGQRVILRDKKGGDLLELPIEIQVREFPKL